MFLKDLCFICFKLRRGRFRLNTVRFTGDNYTYLHWLLGVDLPLKSQNYIHDFTHPDM